MVTASHVSLPLNCKTLKHVSAFMVICLGGGAGNESVYADDVPKGRVIIVCRRGGSTLVVVSD